VRFFSGEKISNATSARKRAANAIQAMNLRKCCAHTAARRKHAARGSESGTDYFVLEGMNNGTGGVTL